MTTLYFQAVDGDVVFSTAVSGRGVDAVLALFAARYPHARILSVAR